MVWRKKIKKNTGNNTFDIDNIADWVLNIRKEWVIQDMVEWLKKEFWLRYHEEY